jgi:hypothetical protein
VTIFEELTVQYLLVDLSEMLGDDVVKCEFEHVKTVCSQSVTHRVVWCSGAFNACANAAQLQLDKLAKHGTVAKCRVCKRPASECWRIFPGRL